MRRQNGFGAVQLILVLIVISIIGFTGWFVWQNQKQTSVILQQSNKADVGATTTSPMLRVNKALITSGWTLDNNTPRLIGFTNVNGEENIANRCFVQASIQTIPYGESTDNLDSDILAEKDHANVKENKGYDYSLIRRQTFDMTVNGEKEKVMGYLGNYYMSDSNSYQLSGYILSEESYVGVVVSCNTPDLTQAMSLLPAISVTM